MKRYFCSIGGGGEEASLAALLGRVLFGGMMAWGHGWPKLYKLVTDFDGFSKFFDGLLGLPGGVNACLITGAEFLCAILVVVGLLGRLATVPVIIGMGVAAFVKLGALPVFAQGGASKELPLMYLIAFSVLLVLGPGKYSLDRLLR